MLKSGITKNGRTAPGIMVLDAFGLGLKALNLRVILSGLISVMKRTLIARAIDDVNHIFILDLSSHCAQHGVGVLGQL